MENKKHWPPQVARVVQEYVNMNLNEEVRQTVYTAHGSGKTETIEAMHPTHTKNALALILRQLKAGKLAYMDEDGTIQFL